MNLKTLISKEELDKRIQEIANQITEDYKNQEVIIVCILTGAVYFATDLTKYIKNDTLKIEFMKVSSYGNSKESTGEVKITKDLENSISYCRRYNRYRFNNENFEKIFTRKKSSFFKNMYIVK